MIEKLKETVNNMQEDEAKHLLQSILIQLHVLHKEYSEDMLQHLIHMPNQLVNHTPYKHDLSESTHIHIMFGDSAAGSLKHMLSETSIHEEHVISFSDAFSIGPIQNLETDEGQKMRQQWLSRNLNAYDLYFEEGYLPAFRQSMEELQSIPKEMPITIWKANNAHEHIGLCFILTLLQGRSNVRVINTSEAHKALFSKEEAIRATGELAPKKLAAMYETYKTASLLEEAVRNELEKEWKEFSKRTEVLRIWEDNKVVSVTEDYFDTFIIECAKRIGAEKSFYKSAKIIGEVLIHLEQYVGDDFLEYRLRMLIKQGVFEMEGSLKAMRYYSVKLNEK